MPEYRLFSLSRLLLVCCGMLLLWSAPASGTPGQIHVVKRPEVNLRAGPGTDAKVIGRLEQGARVMEFARKGRWFRVKQMGRVGPEGWVHGALIAPEKRAQPEPPPPPRSTLPPADEDSAGDGDGRVYYAPSHGRFPHGLKHRSFLPWGVTLKRKGRHHKGKRHDKGKGNHKGKRHHHHDGKVGKRRTKTRAVRPAARNLGSPRRGGAPNIGTF